MVRIYGTPGAYIDCLGYAEVTRNLGIRKVPSARLISPADKATSEEIHITRRNKKINSLIIWCQWKSPRELRAKTVAGVVVTADCAVSD
jgi:hypothetical protein